MSNTQNNGATPRYGHRARRALVVSFDIHRPQDPTPSLAVGSILATARAHPEHGRRFTLEHDSERLDGVRRPSADEVGERIAGLHDLRHVHVIALAAYAWSETLIDPMMSALRQRGFRGDFVVGGYQVTRVVGLDALYPDARYLIEGPAEFALPEILCAPPHTRVVVGDLDVTRLVSPYLSGAVSVPRRAPMVRMETQRGCRWRCSFCSYRGMGETPVTQFPADRVRAELALFAKQGVQKMNVLDAEFNWSRISLDVLRTMVDVGLDARITVQARPENLIRARWAAEFLDLCEELDIHLEFGLQTAIEAESVAVNRRNDIDAVSRALGEVSRRGISHEVSLIYGLPLQTVESFASSLEYVRRHGVPTVRCFPLMLHRGTALSQRRQEFALAEETLDAFDVPFVTSSSTFTRSEWAQMRRMAEAVDGAADAGARVSPVTIGVGR